MKFKLGCDPEVFVTDRSQNFKAAIDTFGGTKKMPRPLPLGPGYFVQEDNVALEFNIPPSDTSESFMNNVRAVVNYLSNVAVDEFDLHFNTASAVSFPPDQLVDPRALEFGCDPDYNAWTGKRNRSPQCKDPNLRTAGGHVHIGILEDVDWNKEDMFRFGRLLDLHLGVPAVLMDSGDLRKILYGKAGAVRIKEYGLEYRVLSNFWIFDDSKTKWVWDSVEHALVDWIHGHDIQPMEEIIEKTINLNNKAMASQLVAEYQLITA